MSDWYSASAPVRDVDSSERSSAITPSRTPGVPFGSPEETASRSAQRPIDRAQQDHDTGKSHQQQAAEKGHERPAQPGRDPAQRRQHIGQSAVVGRHKRRVDRRHFKAHDDKRDDGRNEADEIEQDGDHR